MSQIISSGESSGSIILEYDSLIVQRGGRVGYVELGEGATLDISGGGKVSSASASGLYTEIMVRSGGNLSEANVGLGCWTTVYSGGSVTGIVEDGGWVEVMNGAEVEFVPHVISMLVLTADQYATVHSATTVSSAHVTGTKYSGGMLEVCEGATLSNITVKSNGQVDARGYIYDVMVQDSGYVNAVTNTMEHVQIYNGGYGAVYSMGSGSDVTIFNGGSCNVNGGRATLTEVSSGGSFTVQNCSDSETGSAYQGVADLTTVLSGGVMRLVSGGSAGHTTVGNGGLLELLSGGTATNVVATAGAILKFDFSPDTYIQGTMDGYDFELKDGILSSFLVKSQTLEVSSGGTFVGGTIGDSGSVVISSGAAAENTFVGSNGSIFIEGGGAAIGTIIQTGGSIGIILDENTHVEGTSGGRSFNGKDGIMSGLSLGNGFLEVGSGCLAISTTVSGEGQVRVQKGGLASATTVGSGGSLTVLSGGKAKRVTIGENGHLTVSNGGTLTGRMKFEAGADVFMGNNATLDFDLTQTSAGGAALVNDLSIIRGTPLYTLTVTGVDGDGKYKLAKGASDFNGTLTVRNTSGKNIGSLSVGQTVSLGTNEYTLNLTDDELSVTVVSIPDAVPDGDYKLLSMPQAEYMYGCTPTALSMLLGYYDLNGLYGEEFPNLIEGVVSLKSRGTDGNAYDMDAFDTKLGLATASKDYVYRFYSRDGHSTTPEQELEYSFTNGGVGPELRTDVWNCIADYIGTGQFWRGSDNLSTNLFASTLEDTLRWDTTSTFESGDILRTVDTRYTNMLYGLYLYVRDKGYSLDAKLTGTYNVKENGGTFTFEDYMAEINAGRPVLISIKEHSMVGYGYNAKTREIIFDDCYKADQRMVWDGTYHYSGEDRALQNITVVAFAMDANVDLALVPVAGAASQIVLSPEKDALVPSEYAFAGSPLYLSFAVKNQGESPSGEFAVSLSVDGLGMEDFPFDLDSGDTAQKTNILLPELSLGLHAVRVSANENGMVQESNFANNSAEQKLMVLKASTNVVTGIGEVESGSVSEDDYVAAGAQILVQDGGVSEGTIILGKAPNGSSGGESVPALVAVSSGGIVRNAEVYEYGRIRVSGEAENIRVFSLGEVTVSAGATLSGVAVDVQGILCVESGGELTGRIALAPGVDVLLEDGSILDFDLTQTSAGGAALVNDLSLVQGTPLYTLTVTGTEEHGAYTLADGAAGFDGTITVKDTAGTDLGTLKVGGESLTIGDAAYTLVLADGSLSVTVSDEEPPPPIPGGTAKSDIDGNGVSDVMFVWTGEHGDGNYQHGYWMNGTSEWQSANSNHPAEWDNLGCYDMTGDGKADSVLVGNVEVGGVKGAYIGYYADANDLPDGSTWVNIGYLTNEENIDWKNKVGNLTGNASGANSIVWYAPELYALGAWTDGTENWVSMSSTFGGDDWTLVGCGDFNGNGKDSVLMSGLNGKYLYAAGLDGTSASLGSANWSGWEVRAIGDFAGDGKDDLVLFHNDTGSMVMCANGNVDDFVSIGQLDANDWFVVGCGDYNGDAKDDLLVRQISTGMLGYYSGGNMETGWVELGRGVDMDWTVIA